MGYQFIECNREQQFLLPEDMRSWISEDEPCWFFVNAVEKMNLDGFYARYNNSGVGRKAYDPKAMLCLLLYSHSLGIRSSRKIESMCRRDVSFRIITGNNTPDHTTICRFRKDNADLMESVFVEALALCLKAGMIDPGVIAVDSTRIEANASMDSNMEINEQLRKTIKGWMDEADRIDEEEDELYGPDENPLGRMPKKLQDPKMREKFIDEYFERKREAEQAAKKQEQANNRREAEEKRTRKKAGPRQKTPEEVQKRAEDKKKKINAADPDSRVMKGRKGYLQGFNGQITVTKCQFILSVELSKESSDAQLLHPMIDKAIDNLERISCDEKIEEVVADAGYMSEDNVIRENITEDARIKDKKGPKLYINPKKDRQMAEELKKTPVDDMSYDEDELAGIQKMEMRYRSNRGRELFRIRGTTVEPVFGRLKEGLGFRRFMTRGIDSCRAEFLTICTVHNLMKMHAMMTA